MPGTICSPLEKLWAQRIPGLIDRASLAAVWPALVTASSRVHTTSTRALNVGRANHMTLAPRLQATVVAWSPTAFLAEGVTVPPAFLCERVHPRVGAAEQLKRADVLDDAGLLVVGLFEQEAVVGDIGQSRPLLSARLRESGRQHQADPSRSAAHQEPISWHNKSCAS